MKTTARRPKIAVSADGPGVVSQAGGLLLTEALRVTGLSLGLSAALAHLQPGRRLRLRLAASWPWASQVTTAITRLHALVPG